jgi:hypothetical protein
MKKYLIPVVLGFSFLALMSSCFFCEHDMSVTISDDDDEYEMDASFNRNKTHAVQVYLNEHLLNNRVAFRNRDDEEITLDDNTTIYITTHPGQVSIKIDKEENSEESCEKVRRVCEDLKDIVADN